MGGRGLLWNVEGNGEIGWRRKMSKHWHFKFQQRTNRSKPINCYYNASHQPGWMPSKLQPTQTHRFLRNQKYYDHCFLAVEKVNTKLGSVKSNGFGNSRKIRKNTCSSCIALLRPEWPNYPPKVCEETTHRRELQHFRFRADRGGNASHYCIERVVDFAPDKVSKDYPFNIEFRNVQGSLVHNLSISMCSQCVIPSTKQLLLNSFLVALNFTYLPYCARCCDVVSIINGFER